MPALVSPPTPASLEAAYYNTLKRDRDSFEFDNGLGSLADTQSTQRTESPGKKCKVTFSPDVQVKFLGPPDQPTAELALGKSLDLIREEVKRAIQGHVIQGNSASFNKVKTIFEKATVSESDEHSESEDEDEDDDDRPEPGLVKQYIQGLTANVAILDKRSKDLVYAAIDVAWADQDESFVAAFVGFLGMLCSAHSIYLNHTLHMLVELFDLSSTPIELQHAHHALQSIIQLIPSANSSLAEILHSSWPYADDGPLAHVQYARNILRTAEYAPHLKGNILALITQKIADTDASIQEDLEDLEDGVEDQLIVDESAAVLDMHRDGEADSDIDSDAGAESESPEQRMRKLRGAVQKMDTMIDMLFEHYDSTFSNQALPAIDLERAYESLLSHFQTMMLPSYRSRHTQFLLFHFSQCRPEFIGRFASACAYIAVEDKSQRAMLRANAAAYLASFVARAKKVGTPVVRDIFEIFLNYAYHLRRQHTANANHRPSPDVTRYHLYYSCIQALLYVFCFRWRDLILGGEQHMRPTSQEQSAPSRSPAETHPTEVEYNDLALLDALENSHEQESSVEWIPGIREALHEHFTSGLNPLKVCAPSIVDVFAEVAHRTRFLYVYSILEQNKRVRLGPSFPSSSTGTYAYDALESSRNVKESSMSTKTGDARWQLDAYFPFDPFHLPRSRRWIDGEYLSWEELPNRQQPSRGDEEGDSNSSDCDEEDDEEENEDDFAKQESDSDTASEASFGKNLKRLERRSAAVPT